MTFDVTTLAAAGFAPGGAIALSSPLRVGTLAAMDPFAAIMLGIVVALLIAILLLGRYHPRSGAELLDWKPARSAELEVQNEVDDLEQMLEAANARRRARGESELTEATMRERVAEDLREQNERIERYRDQEDLRQMLEAKNERLRRRGKPEVTEAEFRAQVEAEQARRSG
jgi:hypothetical protein